MNCQYEVCFRDNFWLSTHPLNTSTVLDYFSLSSFYDKNCCNEICRVQRIACTNEIFSYIKIY